MNIKNIEQYVGKFILDELEKQNEELKKLRYLASKVEHCSVCYEPGDDFYFCYICDKIACVECCGNWLLGKPENKYEADYCSQKCYEKDDDSL